MEFVVRIEGLQVDCVIGIFPKERQHAQRLRIDAALTVQLPEPLNDGPSTDQVVDYAKLADVLTQKLVQGRFYLLEVAAQELLATCLEEPRVVQGQVKLTKPAALEHATLASVECRADRLSG